MASNFRPTELQSLDTENFLPPMARWTRLGEILLLATFGAAAVLAGLIRYTPSVKTSVVAQPAGNVELVPAATAGIVERIVAGENQPLEPGEAIAHVDQSPLLGEKANLENQLAELQQELDRVDEYVKTLDEQILTTLKSKTSRRSRQTLEDLPVEAAVVELTQSSPEVAQEFAQERRTLLKQRWEAEKRAIRSQRRLEDIAGLIGETVIRSPMAGTIVKLDLPQPGQTVEADAIVAQMVPAQVPLVFQGWVSQAEIPRLEVGRPVRLKISVYPFQEYGILKGRVKRISLNGIAPQASARQTSKTYYEVLIQPESSYLVKGDRQYGIGAGMEGTAEILVTQERLLSGVLNKAKSVTNF